MDYFILQIKHSFYHWSMLTKPLLTSVSLIAPLLDYIFYSPTNAKNHMQTYIMIFIQSFL
jgi:hypothetical protein